MYTSIIFTLFLCIRIAAISERNIEHTPFHKRDAKTGRLLDVREDRVKLAEVHAITDCKECIPRERQ